MNRDLRLLDDKTLVSLFLKGDSESFGVIVERHSVYLTNVLYQILKDPILIEDVLQDTFIKAMDSLQKGKYAEEGAIRSWLGRIAHNLAIDYHRSIVRSPTRKGLTKKEGRDEFDFFANIGGTDISPEELLIELETDYDIQKLMDSLPEEQREVVYLRHFQGFSFREIVDYIGDISINTALGRMRYGLINLRKKIEEIRESGKKVI